MVSRKRQTRAGDLEPRAGGADPRAGGTDPADRRGIRGELLDALADYHADLRGRGVVPDLTPGPSRPLFAEWGERVVLTPAAAAGLRDLLSKNLELSRRMHDLVREHPDFEVLDEPAACPYRFRYVPNALAERQGEPAVRELLDRLNREIVEAVRRGGPAPLTTARARGRAAIRMSVCPRRTLPEEADAAFEAVARWGRLLNTKYSPLYERPSEMEAQLCSSESHSSPTGPSAT